MRSHWLRTFLLGSTLLLLLVAGLPTGGAGAAEGDGRADGAVGPPDTGEPGPVGSDTDDQSPAESTDIIDEPAPDPQEEPGSEIAEPTDGHEETATVQDTVVVEQSDQPSPEVVVEEPTSADAETTPATEVPVMPAAVAEPSASGEPVHEITGTWIDPPATISRGAPVVAEWRVNVNDSGEPPGNDPVDNVVVDFTLDKALFPEIPDLCLTTDVDPPSILSVDNTVLTCNFGTVAMGTAIVMQTPVVANGVTGEFVTHDGTIDGQTVALPPILIENPFSMDLQLAGASNYWGRWDDVSNPTRVDVDVQWSLRLGDGSDPGPDTVTYQLTVAAQDGSPVQVGFHPEGVGLAHNHGAPGCTEFDLGSADGHPWSHVPTHPRSTNFIDSCTLTQTGPGTFTLTLQGINYDLLNVPELDSFGNLLPTDWDYVASGSLWFRVLTDSPGSIQVTASAPLYTAPTGQTSGDLPGNNTSNKTYTLPGGWSAAYLRSYTGNGGVRWDDTYRVPAGSTVWQYSANHFSSDNVAPSTTYGVCVVLDTAYVEFDPTVPIEFWQSNLEGGGTQHDAPPGTVQYFTGATGDPDLFDCGTGGWTATEPAASTVTAVRMLYPFSTYSDRDALGIQFRVPTKINDDVAIGQDIWMFGSVLRNGSWLGPGNTGVFTPTPTYRYPHTNGRRDVLVTILANPVIRKAAASPTVTPGVPADYTLTYSATGSGSVPDTVDGYGIVDTLPLGMTYAEGSSDPEPVVTTDGTGRQVLTWTVDGVATNTDHELTYQAVPDSSIAPGTVLTNTAVSTLAGQTSQPASASVTTTTNGYTTILKTSDVEYIRNDAGDGVGTGSWTISIESFDPLPQIFTDTIDVLPYNGDLRGTSFSGSYTLDEVIAPAGATVYYTDADPAAVNYDPADPSNGTAGDPTGNTIGWTTTAPTDPTAVRVIGGELAPGGEFAFQVVITTDGAEPQDVYWNSAQARAEHTELVMRTSAALVVTDYELVKTSDPASGSLVDPGDVITYTVTVTQLGDVPAGALFTDDLSQVLDDASYNDDVEADIGTVTVDGDTLSWEGEIPVDGVATITYSVTLNDPDAIAADGDATLVNLVTSPGCRTVEDCTTTHLAGRYEYSKTSLPEPGTAVEPGDLITYRVEIAATFGAVPGAIVTDDLTEVLDDAVWNDDIDVTSGTTVTDGTTLTWTGDLDVGQTVVLTYTVTVTDDGDGQLRNVVTSPDSERSSCVDARDGNPACTTDHRLAPIRAVASSGTRAPTGTRASLPRTGGSPASLVGVSILLIAAGLLLVTAGRRSPQGAFAGHSGLSGEPGLRRAGTAKLLHFRVRPVRAQSETEGRHPDRIPPPHFGLGRFGDQHLPPQRE